MPGVPPADFAHLLRIRTGFGESPPHRSRGASTYRSRGAPRVRISPGACRQVVGGWVRSKPAAPPQRATSSGCVAAFVARVDSGAREGKLLAQRVKQRTARAHLLCQGASCDELQSAKAFCGVQRPPTSLPACSSRRGASSAPRTYKLVLILTRHTLARAGLANRPY